MEQLVLGMLKIGPAHGYELRERIRGELGPAWRVASSQLYAWLPRLEEQGLVRGSPAEGADGPPRVVYALTDAGEERFDAWLREGSLAGRRVRGAHLVRLYFVLRFAPERLTTYVAQEREVLARRRRALLAQQAGPSPFREAVRRQRLAHVESGLQWLDGLGKLLAPKEES